MVCPACSERVPYPGYVCPGPPRTRHRDVRPGRFGIVRRRCQCGKPMKTLLLFGSSRMTAFCPHCGHLLEHRPGEAPEIVLPFFGAVGAGKTRLLFSIVTQLQVGRGRELSAEFADSVTTRELDAAEETLRSGSATPRPRPELPRALSSGSAPGRAPGSCTCSTRRVSVSTTPTAPRSWHISARRRRSSSSSTRCRSRRSGRACQPAARRSSGWPAPPPRRPSWRTSRPTSRSRRWACRCRKPGWPSSSAAPT